MTAESLWQRRSGIPDVVQMHERRIKYVDATLLMHFIIMAKLQPVEFVGVVLLFFGWNKKIVNEVKLELPRLSSHVLAVNSSESLARSNNGSSRKLSVGRSHRP